MMMVAQMSMVSIFWNDMQKIKIIIHTTEQDICI